MAVAQDDIELLWKESLASYEQDAKHSLSPEVLRSLGRLQSTDDLLALLEAQDQKFQGWRNRHEKLWSALNKFVAPLSTLLRIAKGPAESADFGVVTTGVIGALYHLVKSCESVSDAYDWIEQVFKELQDFSERLEIYAQTVLDSILRKKIAAILSFMLRVIGRAECLVRERRFREYLRVTFLGKDAETKKLVDDLNRLFGSEQRFLLAVTYASTQKTEEATKKIGEQVATTGEDIRQALGALQVSESRAAFVADEGQLKHVLASTTAFEVVEEIYARNRRALLKGTGGWLNKEPLFNAWVQNEAPILWIFGGPGVGKSFLTTWIIQLLTEEMQNVHEQVAYFFAKENSENLRDANIILKTLALQLANGDQSFREHALKVVQQRSMVLTAEDTWENLFLGYYGNLKKPDRTVKIILDGLDEASHETRRTILGLMKRWVQSTSNKSTIQFAVLGRPSLRDDAEFTRLEKTRFIEVSRDKNHQDIDRYVKSRLEEMDVLHVIRRGPGGVHKANRLGAMIAKKVLEGADGVFLWAKLLIDGIVRRELRDIEAILAKPPSTLDEMIWSVFDRLAKDDELNHDLLRRMLLLMTYARRPLLFGELDLFLSLPSRKPNFLLWNHTRGKLSSVFDLKYPEGYNPDEDEQSDADVPEMSDEETAYDESISFDFTDEGDMGDFEDLTSFAESIQSQEEGESGATEDGTYEGDFLSSGQLKTTVAFCHTRIRDYLTREGSVETRKKPELSIIPSLADSNLDITLLCLQVFRLELWRQDDKKFLLDYPLGDMVYHLGHLDRDSLSQKAKDEVTEGLRWLLSTKEGAESVYFSPRHVDDFRGTWVFLFDLWVKTSQHFKVIQAWFSDPGIMESPRWTEEEKTWIKDASTSMETLLRQLMLVASREWLLKPEWDTGQWADKGEFACTFLEGWLSMIEEHPTDIEIPGESSLSKISPERLEQLASWAGFEKNTYWYASLGWICMGGNHHEAAERYFLTSVDMDPNAWVAMEGLGRITAAREDWIKAIEWLETSISVMPFGVWYFAGSLYPFIVEWYIKLEDYEKAYEAAEAGYKANDWQILAQQRMIELYHHRSEFNKVVQLVQELHDRENGDPILGANWLVRLLVWGGFDELGKKVGPACRAQGYPTFILDDLELAVKHVELDDSYYLLEIPRMAAEFKYTYYGLEDDAARLYELFLSRLATQSSSQQQEWAEQRKVVTQRLAQLYFDAAVATWKQDPGGHNMAANKLKLMAVEVSTSFADDYDGFDLYRQDYAAMLWGRWLRDYAQVDKPQWRKVFQPRILEELNSFDDDDPTNDSFGLKSLIITLFHAGDRRNAAGLLAILLKTTEEKPEEEIDGDGTDKKDEDQQTTEQALLAGAHGSGSVETTMSVKLTIPNTAGLVICDTCERETAEVKEMWFCEICLDVNFCEECLPKLRAATAGPFPELQTHVCNPGHDLYCAWPIPEEARYLAAESFENGVTVRKAWLENLRQEWWA
ncbi:hypothetical protein GQ53DRAFT_842374 [Thozetella sp. PMI_491]|nr:hypothetical protein GQ53DRAFT_842374 [Thozetella sp. PMI_491]